MDKQMQAAPISLRGRMFSRDNTRLKEQRILVLKTGIAGLYQNTHGEEEQARVDALTPGTELLMYREPDNKYDEWAIAIYVTEDDKLGYMSRFKNEAIARLMDAGKKFIAVVDDPQEEALEAPETEEDRSRRRRAPTENMSLPFSVYLVES